MQNISIREKRLFMLKESLRICGEKGRRLSWKEDN
jgi:hypothetical protein